MLKSLSFWLIPRNPFGYTVVVIYKRTEPWPVTVSSWRPCPDLLCSDHEKLSIFQAGGPDFQLVSCPDLED